MAITKEQTGKLRELQNKVVETTLLVYKAEVAQQKASKELEAYLAELQDCETSNVFNGPFLRTHG
jgi:hypothetical protein